MSENRQDQAIIYESYKKEIKGDLEDLKKAGFQTESLEKEFENITTKVDSNLTITPIEGSATAMLAKDITAVYIAGIEKLKEFQKKLKAYDVYYNCSYSCDSLEAQLEDKGLDLAEALPMMVKEICTSLNVIIHSNDEAYQNEKDIVERIIALAYRIMKLEFVVLGSSEVFDKVSEMTEHIGLFESLIREDLKIVNLEAKKYSQIRNRINRINQNGVNSHLVDEKLIQFIAGMIDKECMKTLKENFDKWGKKITEQQWNFVNEQELLNQLDDQYNYQKKKRVKPKLVGRSLLLVGTAIIGTILITNVQPNKLKEIEAEKLKEHTVTYYPTLYEEMLDGEVVASFTKDELKPELDDVQIIKYSPYQADGNMYTRDITTYRLPATSASMPLEELATLDLVEIEGETTSETKETLFPSEFYEQDMIRIIRIFDEKKSYDVVDQESFEKDLKNAQAIVTALLRAAVGLPLAAEWALLIKAIKDALAEAKRKREYSEKVTAILERMLIIFQENKELRMNFDKLYPFYERIIPEDAAAILQTRMKDVGKDMQEETTKLEYGLKKRPQ